MFGITWLTEKIFSIIITVLLVVGISLGLYYLVWSRGFEAGKQECLDLQVAAAKKEDSIKTEMAKEVQKELQKFVKASIALAKDNAKIKQEFKDDTQKNCPKLDPNSPALLLTTDELHVLDRAFGLSGSNPKGATSGVSRPGAKLSEREK